MNKLKLLLILSASALIMSACGTKEADTPAVQEQPVEQVQPETTTPEVAPTPAPAEQPKQDATIKQGNGKTTTSKSTTVQSELEKAGKEVVNEAKTAASNKAKKEINKTADKAKEKINNIFK